jgi:exopolyphosphatase/guanosine-5'-triphosphate,3'-diphosphate pyrophosphatase
MDSSSSHSDPNNPAFAALDVGSHTIRLLVVRPTDNDLERLCDESRFVRLGLGVDAAGNLDPDRRRAAVEAIRELAAIAHASGVTAIRAIATSAVRDAHDGADFAREVLKQAGIDLEILPGDEEARLTFLGTTVGMDLSQGALVADIGGGSTELVASAHGEVAWGRSLQLGSGRLTERFCTQDPPSAAERRAVEAEVKAALRPLSRLHVEKFISTGGTAVKTVTLIAGGDGTSTPVTLGSIRDAERRVYELSSADISDRYGIRPDRTKVLPAGVTILRVMAEWSRARRIIVTRHGIREGVILDMLTAGAFRQ